MAERDEKSQSKRGPIYMRIKIYRKNRPQIAAKKAQKDRATIENTQSCPTSLALPWKRPEHLESPQITKKFQKGTYHMEQIYQKGSEKRTKNRKKLA